MEKKYHQTSHEFGGTIANCEFVELFVEYNPKLWNFAAHFESH